MSETPDEIRQAAVRAEVLKLMPELEAKSVQELQKEVQSVPWSTEPTVFGTFDFLRVDMFRKYICPHANEIGQGVDGITYAAILLLPVFPAHIPVAIAIKVAGIIVRVGVSGYCKGWTP
jgi:hypothetical protein